MISYLTTVGCNRLRHRMRLRNSDLQRMRDAEEDIRKYAGMVYRHSMRTGQVNIERMMSSVIKKAYEYCNPDDTRLN